MGFQHCAFPLARSARRARIPGGKAATGELLGHNDHTAPVASAGQYRSLWNFLPPGRKDDALGLSL